MGNFFTNLFNQFSNYIMIGLALIIVGLGIWLAVARNEVADLTIELGTAKQEILNQKVEISNLNLSIALQKKAIEAVEARAVEKATEAADLAKQLAEIENAPETEDGPMADVLCRAITGSKCVRPDSPSTNN